MSISVDESNPVVGFANAYGKRDEKLSTIYDCDKECDEHRICVTKVHM